MQNLIAGIVLLGGAVAVGRRSGRSGSMGYLDPRAGKCWFSLWNPDAQEVSRYRMTARGYREAMDEARKLSRTEAFVEISLCCRYTGLMKVEDNCITVGGFMHGEFMEHPTHSDEPQSFHRDVELV
jgi:hypothetical protein